MSLSPIEQTVTGVKPDGLTESAVLPLSEALQRAERVLRRAEDLYRDCPTRALKLVTGDLRFVVAQLANQAAMGSGR